MTLCNSIEMNFSSTFCSHTVFFCTVVPVSTIDRAIEMKKCIFHTYTVTIEEKWETNVFPVVRLNLLLATISAVSTVYV